MRVFFWQRTGTKVSLGVLVFAFGLILYVILAQGTPPTVFEVIWLLLPPFFAIFVFYVQPMRLSNQAAQNEQLVTEVTWEVNESGVQISSRFSSSLMEWDALKNMLPTKNYYLLLSKKNKNAFRFIPRRAFRSPQGEQLFLDLVRQHIPVG